MQTAVTYFNIDTPQNERHYQVKCDKKAERATRCRHCAAHWSITLVAHKCNLTRWLQCGHAPISANTNCKQC